MRKNTQNHLSGVYSLLGRLSATATVGAVSDGYVLHIPFIIALGLSWMLLGLVRSPRSQVDGDAQRRRMQALYAFAFVQGGLLAPSIQYYMNYSFDPTGLVISVLLYTGLIFASASLSAMYFSDELIMSVSTLLGSVLTTFLATSFMGILFGNSMVAGVSIYLGLAVFIGYILIDTRNIINRVENNPSAPRDTVNDALMLFTNLINIVAYLFNLFVQQENRKRREQIRRARRRS